MKEVYAQSDENGYTRRMTDICTPASFTTLCTSRRSVRAFTDEPLTEKDLLKLLDVARHAPSVQNVQPWHFHVITKEELMRNILDAACYGNFTIGNPTLIVVTCDTTARPDNQEIVWNPKELEYSCVGAMELVLLAATTAHLGGCWVSFHHGPVHAALKLPQTQVIVGGLLLGHPDEAKANAGEHLQRKELTDVVRFHE